MKTKTMNPARWAAHSLLGLMAFLTLTGFDGCFSDHEPGDHDHASHLHNTLFVAHNGGSLVSYDIETGKARPGEIPDLKSPTDIQALKDGTVLVNLTESNEILIVNGKTMEQKARIPSSTIGGTRPVHSYLTNVIGGKQYWVTFNDGDGTAATNSVRFINVTEGHEDYLKPVGEAALGIGHHKAAWSATKERVLISNIADLNDVFTVLDYSDIKNITRVKTLDWKSVGVDSGKSASPHGCATAKANGKGYCNVTGNGSIVSVDMDAADPAFKVIKTKGVGGGYTTVHTAGRFVYSVQSKPREGDTVYVGAPCQIGQLAVIDATTDSLVKELPLFYKGGDCTESIAAGEAKAASPSHIIFNHTGKMAYVAIGGGAGASRMEGVLDITDPANPKQLASVEVGASGSRGHTLDGNGNSIFTINATDGTISQINAATGAVEKTIAVNAAPKTITTYGDDAGPGHQTGPLH